MKEMLLLFTIFGAVLRHFSRKPAHSKRPLTALNTFLATAGRVEKFDIVQNAANNVAISIGFNESKAFDLNVFTVNGQRVLNQFFKERAVLFNFKTPDLASGLLLFQLKIKDKTVVKKLILK